MTHNVILYIVSFFMTQASNIDPDYQMVHSDLSRSVQRMSYTSMSRWSTLSCCMKVWDFHRKELLTGQELMAVAGFVLNGNTNEYSYKEYNRFAGNAMTPSVLGAALLSMCFYVLPADSSTGRPLLSTSSLNHLPSTFFPSARSSSSSSSCKSTVSSDSEGSSGKEGSNVSSNMYQ
jgi:hypothetical protein